MRVYTSILFEQTSLNFKLIFKLSIHSLYWLIVKYSELMYDTYIQQLKFKKSRLLLKKYQASPFKFLQDWKGVQYLYWMKLLYDCAFWYYVL